MPSNNQTQLTKEEPQEVNKKAEDDAQAPKAESAFRAPRCQHILTNGTQCGSPALKDKKLCYYHDENHAEPARIYIDDGDSYPDRSIQIPPFEDAHSIQKVLRHVVLLMMEHRIERKDASLMLYALQIASGNLKRMADEKPRPTQVVRDPETTGETPLGMTPWSASGQGHDPEEEENDASKNNHTEKKSHDEGPGARNGTRAVRPTPLAEFTRSMKPVDRVLLRQELAKNGMIRQEEYEAWKEERGPDPLLWGLEREAVSRLQKW